MYTGWTATSGDSDVVCWTIVCVTSHGSTCALSASTSIPRQPAASLQWAATTTASRYVRPSPPLHGGHVEKISIDEALGRFCIVRSSALSIAGDRGALVVRPHASDGDRQRCEVIEVEVIGHRVEERRHRERHQADLDPFGEQEQVARTRDPGGTPVHLHHGFDGRAQQ